MYGSSKSPSPVEIQPDKLDLQTLRTVYHGPAKVVLSSRHIKNIEASHSTVANVLADEKTVYGINTGFGLLARTKIESSQLEKLQKNLVLSHMTGVGRPLPDAIVRLVLVMKIMSLSKGHSGVSTGLVMALCALLENGVYPSIPEKGSVGASGDLAPLAHLSGVLLGIGSVRFNGEEIPAKDGLKKAGLKPLTLGPKEGLALLNGTQVSTALALGALFEVEQVFGAALVAGAMSVDAAKGSDVPFDARIQDVRGQVGQTRVAGVLRDLLTGSDIRASHTDCKRVQDPYCLRCQPQVMGACLDSIDHAAKVLLREAGAVSDNPLIFALTGEILSGGNFHAEPVAIAADILAIALAEIGSMSERRTSLLMDEKLSGLPAFLVAESGLNSGFMIAQVTAAALTSENKQMSSPASVDSIPTSANQEDHVSMATFAARRLLDMAENAKGIVAIELLAAAQGVDFHAPVKTSKKLSRVHARLRKDVPFYDEDRPFTPDIEAVKSLISGPLFMDLAADLVPKGED